MTARATQPAGYSAGQAQVQVTGAGAVDVDTLEVCVSGLLDSVEKHLDPRLTGEAWTTTYVWVRPAAPRLEGSALLFDFEPSVTWHLRPHAPYMLRLRDARGLKREERLTWVPIRLPSRAPQDYVPPATPAPKPAARPVPSAETGQPAQAEAQRAQAEREVAAAAAALAVDLKRREDEGEERRQEQAERLRREQEAREQEARETRERGRKPGRGKTLARAGIAALLLAAAAGAWFYKDWWETPVAPIQPEVPTTLEGARQFLARDPGADESFGMAEKFRTAKSIDGEFLLLRNAANKGNAPAALALGEMYDPATHSPETSPLPAPNPEQAVEWYRQAAEAGIAEAQYRLGMLLMSGKTDEPNGPELGVSWLRKAADQGHPQAKDVLPK